MKTKAEELLDILNRVRPQKITIYQEVEPKSFCESVELEPIAESYETIKGSNAKARFDRGSNFTRTFDHFHVIVRGREAFAVNLDGTAHHRSNKGFRVNNRIGDFLRSKGVNLASDNILESYELDDDCSYRVFQVEI